MIPLENLCFNDYAKPTTSSILLSILNGHIARKKCKENINLIKIKDYFGSVMTYDTFDACQNSDSMTQIMWNCHPVSENVPAWLIYPNYWILNFVQVYM